ncbi:type IV secretion system protein [Bartonella heixiaziensis]|uniref:type IV secretion system protein n=1 Tax=Bartonella heixiaziensis TaxID=1461000 RepID=UPI003D2047B4
MKKAVIAITTIAILGIPSSATAFTWGAGAADLGASVSTGWMNWFSRPSKPKPKKPSIPQHYAEIINLIKQQLELNKEHIEKTKETHKSLTGNRKSDTREAEYTSFFLKDPQLVYDKNSDVLASKFKSLNAILKEEEISDSISQARKSIEKRILYATAIDRNISSQAFQNTEARLKHILVLLKQIDKTTDLKDIAELQAYMKGMLAIIQNENAKIQMVAHLRNTEREFIKQQKYKRNMKILNSKNTGMPTIQFIR